MEYADLYSGSSPVVVGVGHGQSPPVHRERQTVGGAKLHLSVVQPDLSDSSDVSPTTGGHHLDPVVPGVADDQVALVVPDEALRGGEVSPAPALSSNTTHHFVFCRNYENTALPFV